VAHVYGTGKERGLAYGAILKPYLSKVIAEFFTWIEVNVESAVKPYVPEDIAKLIAIYGIDAVLDLQYELMKHHMSEEFIQEVEGIAEASGLSYALMMRMVVFPDLVKAHCSMVGAWGEATAPAYSDSLVQLRALDWATNSPLQQFPLVTVYHSNATAAFSTLGWPGFVGALTGMSNAPMGICEKVWLHYQGKDRRNGIPIGLMLRDILEFDSSVEEAKARINNADRTCSIFVGIGSPTSPEKFNIVQYARDYAKFYNDSDFEVSNPEHPQLKNIVYVDKHSQPSHDPCLGSILQEAHGSVTPTTMVDVCATLQTGDTHAAVYDFLKMEMLVSNASPFVNGSFVPAYNRQFVKLDMNALFSEPLNREK